MLRPSTHFTLNLDQKKQDPVIMINSIYTPIPVGLSEWVVANTNPIKDFPVTLTYPGGVSRTFETRDSAQEAADDANRIQRERTIATTASAENPDAALEEILITTINTLDVENARELLTLFVQKVDAATLQTVVNNYTPVV
jgi:hypothetical protein